MRKLSALIIALIFVIILSGCMSPPKNNYETYKKVKVLAQEFLSQGEYIVIDNNIPPEKKFNEWDSSYTFFWTRSSIIKIEVDEMQMKVFVNGAGISFYYEEFDFSSDKNHNILLTRK